MPTAGDERWLGELFLAELLQEDRDRSSSDSRLEEILASFLEQGTEAWPTIEIAPEKFVRHLAHAAMAANADNPLEVLPKLRSSDLYLACACALGQDVAIASFEEEIFPKIIPAVRSLGASDSVVDETCQQLREFLFVAGGEGRPAGIANYAGLGQLRSWVRSIAVRTAMKLLGKSAKVAGDEALASIPDDGQDVEIELLKREYGQQFREALQAQLAELTERQRNLLKQHYLDGLSIDQVGKLYKVHRATAARWISAAREALFDGTRARLIENLQLDPCEFESVVRLVRSQLDLSLHRFL
jgi:RNA polymerase sigma-70 factor (ECF subfamily)